MQNGPAAFLLGIIEGLTEFLPISSTGHLMVAGRLLGFHSEPFEMFIQLGALGAVWWLFRGQIFRLNPLGSTFRQEEKRMLTCLLLGFLPALVLGKLTHHWIREHFFSATSIACASIIGGIIILVIERRKTPVKIGTWGEITPVMALLVGLGQCLALFPGVSRSGATIMTALVLGFSRSVAIEFTFLLAIPTMTAVGVYELYSNRQDLDASMAGLLAIGFFTAFATAMVVVKWLIRFVQNHTFEGFAWYRIVTGAILLGLIYLKIFPQL